MMIEERIENVIQRYLLEFSDVTGAWKGKAAFNTLNMFPFPSDIQKFTLEEVVLQKWKPHVQRGIRINRATRLLRRGTSLC
jgi:transposase